MLPAKQLEDAARAMIDAAGRGQSPLLALETHAPHVYRQIARDAKYPGLLRLWGRSSNVDEVVGETIVDPAILAALGSLAGVSMRGRSVHAGLEHTYGYLFASIVTPYGAKRERWISTALERGFGLPASLLGDRPSSGTLLANATWLFGRIAFRDQPQLLRALDRNSSAVAEELVKRDMAGYEVRRIVEEFELPGKIARKVTLITDLVAYPHSPSRPDVENSLLAYSLQNGSRAPRRLITGFPVRADTVRELLASVPRRGLVAVRPQYNAFVPGWPGGTVRGRRYCSNQPAST